MATVSLLGQELTVKERIGYKAKADAAAELAEMMTIFNEDAGVAYESYLTDAFECYIRVKYYTDADLSKYTGKDWIFDFMDDYENSDATELCDATNDDWDKVLHMAFQLHITACDAYQSEHSLSNRVLKSFAFLFDGRDLTETLAQAREVNEQMIDHLGDIAKAKPVDLAQYAKKKQK